jgi:hypothetical protein
VPLDPAGFVERSIADKTPPAQRDARDSQAIRAWAAGIAADLERS